MNRINYRPIDHKLKAEEEAFVREIYKSGLTHMHTMHSANDLKKMIAQNVLVLSKFEENKEKKLTELMHEIYMEVCTLREAENYEDKKD